jgi:hypothetical protein
MASSFRNIPGLSGNESWKDPVATVGDLPASGNTAGDARVVTATNTIYIWSGSAWVAVGGGGGSGLQLVVTSVSSPITASSTANREFIYLVSGTTTITLPTAVGNASIYSIKNVGVNTVTIATTSSQTIDGSLTAPLPVPNTSLTLISNNSNWSII